MAQGTTAHPDENELAELMRGVLVPARAQEIDDHLDDCDECRRMMAALARRSTASTVPLARGSGPGGVVRTLAPGETVGRFVVQELIGAGAMGAVYAAYDPKLDRKLALKVLHSEAEAAVEEAQSLARLAHPNVVAIHDAGTFEGRVFLAMEYVEGEHLGKWLEQPRSWRAVLDVFLAVGQGLVAAHASGLVHRDIKPANLLLGRDGRARVTDFGLARARSAQAPEGVGGTPAYMSPEQLSGQPADTQSDQFSFCVSLYEALYGERPFRGATTRDLLESIKTHRLLPRPARGSVLRGPTGHVPAWVRSHIVRGLSPRPEDRFPSMESLLAGLGRDPWVARRRWIAGSALLGASALLVAFLAGGSSCTSDALRIDEIWNPARRDIVESALARVSDDRFDAISRALDGWTGRWKSSYLEACGVERPGATRDRKMGCLLARRAEVDALVGALASGSLRSDGGLRAMESIDLAGCTNGTALLAGAPVLPSDPALAARVSELRDRLAAVKALQYAGRMAEATALAGEIAASARALGWKPLEAQAMLQEAYLASGRYELPRAEAGARSAAQAAAAAKDHVVWIQALALLAELSLDAKDLDEADRFVAEGLAVLDRSPHEGRSVAELRRIQGWIAREREDPLEAERRFREELAMRERYGAPVFARALALAAIADAVADSGRLTEAAPIAAEAIDMLEREYGPRDADLPTALETAAIIEERLGHAQKALALYERSMAIAVVSDGADSVDVAFIRWAKAELLTDMGRFQEARTSLEGVCERMETDFGEANDSPAWCRVVRARALAGSGDARRAERDLTDVYAALRADGGAGKAVTLDAAAALGELLLARGKVGEAEALANEARTPGALPRDLGALDALRGEVFLRKNLAKEAARTLEIALQAHLPENPVLGARMQHRLARALIASGGDAARARSLAESARKSFDDFGNERESAVVSQWLSSLP